jgi:flagellar secretion chaperone FliS
MTPAGYAGYRNVIVNTIENKEEILLMLYEGALISVRMARRGIEEKNPKLRGEKISKVLAILTELDCALDMEKGGELAENLSVLYRYIMDLLTVANVKDDPEALVAVESILGELYEGFRGAAQREALPVYTKTGESEMTGGLTIAI